MAKKTVDIKWDSEKDEAWTYFGKCECGYTNVMAGDKYCGECGSKIKNPFDSER